MDGKKKYSETMKKATQKNNIPELICHGRLDKKIERVIIILYEERHWHLKTEYFKVSSTKKRCSIVASWKGPFITG